MVKVENEFEDIIKQEQYVPLIETIKSIEDMNSIEELNHELEEHIEHITEDETDQYDSGKINDIESLKCLVLKALKRRILFYLRNHYNGQLFLSIELAKRVLEQFTQQTSRAFQNQKDDQAKIDLLNLRNRFYQEMNEKINKLNKDYENYQEEMFENPDNKITLEEIKRKRLEARELRKLIEKNMDELVIKN